MKSLIHFWLSYGRLYWSKIYRFLFEWKYRNVQLPSIYDKDFTKLLFNLQRYLSQIIWRQDPFYMLYDAISYPQTVWSKGRDDCDGFAILAMQLLENAKKEGCNLIEYVYMLTVVGKPIKQSHSVCIFLSKVTYKWRIVDLDYVVAKEFDTILDCVKHLSKRFEELYCWNVIDINLKEIKSFSKS